MQDIQLHTMEHHRKYSVFTFSLPMLRVTEIRFMLLLTGLFYLADFVQILQIKVHVLRHSP